MTSKERVHAALEGRPVDRTPVTSLYNHLYHRDHFSELTGRPEWELWRWLYERPEEHVQTYRRIVEQAPLEILQPDRAPSRAARENTEVVQRDGSACLHHRKTDTYEPLATISGHPVDYLANETQTVFDKKDADEKIKVTRAEDQLASGCNDYAEAAVASLGRDHFIMAGGLVGALWAAHNCLGQTNVLAMLIEKPDLVEYVEKKCLAQNIETIRQLATAGGDAIFLDDAMGTSDMISVTHYERFCLPYMTEMVREIHNLGHKAIVIYFGGVADRLEQIASTGADGFAMETSMKGYVNDIDEIAASIGDRVTVFGNLDPIGVLENGTDEGLGAEVRRQAAAGQKARGFVMCTGSPITPGTPVARVQRFVELGSRPRA